MAALLAFLVTFGAGSGSLSLESSALRFLELGGIARRECVDEVEEMTNSLLVEEGIEVRTDQIMRRSKMYLATMLKQSSTCLPSCYSSDMKRENDY